ncbi:hypothetical protein SCUCBS95973_003701 [Sporothrix curviconia]|uniref:NADH:flavin oxidoreductase/NADH oxidase N-terminal domain-containing protein n=1 Tax=Sporothrix curviconia TaxID=1260050 RepID=A0ABP0BIJ5_9PEZI
MPAAITPPLSFAPLRDTRVFSPWHLGSGSARLTLAHRIVQAPCTRMRGDKVERGVYVPVDRHVTYYQQRASAGGLQITEALDICLDASAYPGVPGVFTDAQLAGWKKVTDAVHAKGGFMVAQLWHTGRASSAGLRGGKQPVSSSAKPMPGSYLDGTDCAANPPRPLTVDEIHALTAEWAAAAKRAVDVAGFDAVEIHGANGYLLEQFLHDNINTADRTDAYGGASIATRCRFVLEVVEAVAAAVGAGRTGIRLSPYNYFQGTRDSDPNAHWAYLCEQLAGLSPDSRPAYVHMIEPRFDEELDEQKKMASLAASTTGQPVHALTPFREVLQKGGIAFLAAGGFDRDNMVPKIEAGLADAVVLGRHFIANPDLVARLRNGWPLNAYDRATFYGASPPEKGYTDYPVYAVDAVKTAGAEEAEGEAVAA